MKYIDESFAEIKDVIKNTPDTEMSPQAKMQFAEMVDEVKKKILNPLDTDKWIYRLVVCFLGLAILAGLTFSFFLSLKNADPNTSI